MYAAFQLKVGDAEHRDRREVSQAKAKINSWMMRRLKFDCGGKIREASTRTSDLTSSKQISGARSLGSLGG
jgi:hypothetical protein